MTIVVFSIGNPGPMVRHSSGHLGLKYIMSHLSAKQLTKSGNFSLSHYDNDVIFAKSNGYMNESGKVFKLFIEKNKIRLHQACVVIVYDEFDINLGKVKLTPLANKASHNGIKSIISSIGRDNVQQMYKLGIGIGPKPVNASKDQMGSWVLSKFRQEEEQVMINSSIPRVIDYIEFVIEVDGEISDYNEVNKHLG